MNERQKKQKVFEESGTNIILGNIGDFDPIISLVKEKIVVGYENEDVKVLASFENGLTAKVYQVLYKGKCYNLKVKRVPSLVKNIDGETSFLNEVQRRKDFEELRKGNLVIDKGVVKTLYANYREGIILSEWIKGEEIKEYTRDIFRSLFTLTWYFEKSGVMEWDLCSSNILLSNKQVKLFDFGYAYTYDPLTEYNSEGNKLPLFNSVERFETRSFMPYLLEKNEGEILSIYRVEKEEAIRIYEEKLNWLIKNEASEDLIETAKEQLRKWRQGLTNLEELKKLYRVESIRSYVLDIHDDVSGKSCTPKTLLKIKKVIELIRTDHEFFLSEDAYLWDDKLLSRQQLLKKYEKLYEIANLYQV